MADKAPYDENELSERYFIIPLFKFYDLKIFLGKVFPS